MDFETPLCALGYKYGTDKCPQIANKYTPLYYELFQPKRETVKKLLEIGIGGIAYRTRIRRSGLISEKGASLKMWRDFFPSATIYGADIDPATMFTSERIQTIICDERDKKQLNELVGVIGPDVDIVIDDGSHHLADQVFLCKFLMSKLTNPTYIIEDVKHLEILDELAEYRPQLYSPDPVRPNSRLLVLNK